MYSSGFEIKMKIDIFTWGDNPNRSGFPSPRQAQKSKRGASADQFVLENGLSALREGWGWRLKHRGSSSSGGFCSYLYKTWWSPKLESVQREVGRFKIYWGYWLKGAWSLCVRGTLSYCIGTTVWKAVSFTGTGHWRIYSFWKGRREIINSMVDSPSFSACEICKVGTPDLWVKVIGLETI